MIDLDTELSLLFEETPSRVSTLPQKGTLEIVRDRANVAAGYIVLEVRGFLDEDDKPLRRAFLAALDAHAAVAKVEARRREELNPLGKADPAGEAFAAALVKTELGEWKNKAVLRLHVAAQHICFLGVVGYAAGQLKHRGEDIPYATEEREVLGKKRTGLATKPLAWLEAAGFTLRLAIQLLSFSAGIPLPTKEEQWTKEAQEKPEAEERAKKEAAGHAESPQVSA